MLSSAMCECVRISDWGRHARMRCPRLIERATRSQTPFDNRSFKFGAQCGQKRRAPSVFDWDGNGAFRPIGKRWARHAYGKHERAARGAIRNLSRMRGVDSFLDVEEEEVVIPSSRCRVRLCLVRWTRPGKKRGPLERRMRGCMHVLAG
eukprot:2138111-Rhodomonas_salina.1